MKRRVTLAVIAALAVDANILFARAGAPVPSIPAATLMVETDPAGAAVYVDGRLSGYTPLAVSRLSTTDHRVRLVKQGYLENARVVGVGGGTRSLRVKLTPDRGSRLEAAQIEAGGGAASAGRSHLPLILGLAGGGGAAAFVLGNGGGANHTPTAGSISAVPVTGIVATVTTFATVGANDSDGDTLISAWTFGDGGTASGATVTHSYTVVGTHNVGVTVSDSHGGSATATLDVNVTSLTAANWSGAPSGWSSAATVALTQSGTDLTGTFTDGNGSALLAGSIDPGTRQVTFTITFTSPPKSMRFVGAPSSAVKQLVGACYNIQGTNCGQNGSPWTLTRP